MTQAEELFVSCLKIKDSKTLSCVKKEWLEGVERRQYQDIINYYKSEGEVMGVKTFCEKYSLDISEADSKPRYYLQQLKDRYIYTQISDKIPRIVTDKSEPREKLEKLQELVGNLATDSVMNNDPLYSDDLDKRVRAYNDRMKSLGVTYLSMGCDDMDKTFYGYRETDVVTIGGKSGQGKTWLICYLVLLLDNVIKKKEKLTGEKLSDILFITNEMGVDEVEERIDCLRFGLPYQKFISGKLDEDEYHRYKRGLRHLKREGSRIRFVENCSTIDELTTYLGIYQPSAVFIDGSYMMEPKLQEGWEKITYITRNFKHLARSFKTPIINTTQLKRRTGTKATKDLSGQDDFAYSNSYVQDSDIALRLYQDADMKFHSLIGAEVVKGRRVVAGTTVIFQNDLDTMKQSLTIAEDETSAKEPEIKTDF